jgi:hypothetical protein
VGRLWQWWKELRAVWATLLAVGLLWKLAISGVLALIAFLVLDELSRRWRELPRGTHDAAYVTALLVSAAVVHYGYSEWWLGKRRDRRNAVAAAEWLREQEARFERQMEAENIAREAARQTEAVRYRERVHALRRACIEAMEAVEASMDTQNGPIRAREVLTALRIEWESVGPQRLGEEFAARFDAFHQQLQALVGVRFLTPEPIAAKLAVRKTKDAILRDLDEWLERSRP